MYEYALIIVLLILLIQIYFYRDLICKKLNGTFVGTPEFISDSGLEKFILHINGTKSYLYISNSEEVIFNDVINFKYNFYLPSRTITTQLFIPELENEWQTNFYYILEFDVINNKLEIFDSSHDTMFVSAVRCVDKIEPDDSESLN
jgi:hypothetical protein